MKVVRNLKYRTLFSGLGVASVTPFKSDFSVDEQAILNLCNYFIKSKVSFVVVQGTTGESATLSDNEKEFVNDFFIKNLYSKIPLVLGIGSNNTNEIISKLKSVDLSFTATVGGPQDTTNGLFISGTQISHNTRSE